ncbi:hypothetical protein DV737_g4108, partial [Chaetothyriales sp. CBS 132003]
MTTLRRLWLRWKALRLPWRKTFLVGQDLSGNTYWEFKDALRSNRFRRRVRFHGKTHLSDVQVSPLWHQWLRYTRAVAPTLQEQAADVARQAQLKHNARLADERWATIDTNFFFVERTRRSDQGELAAAVTATAMALVGRTAPLMVTEKFQHPGRS